ncbi:hypothetical protein TD95_001750 [Thielaviopsis punctulata]|uniref:BHLH domain-containing protein n=1 Tax=Thielaviopsis punctulata TaxID=72032 RepID=A0A0F4Z6Z1_9PEZI|nr:hypothetical protein TD95_001750 [Thielaviopsis punctulata]
MAHSEPHSAAAGTGTGTGSAPLGLRDMLNSQSERHDSAYYGTPSEASSKRMDIESPQSSPSPNATGWLTVTAPPADTSGTSFVGPNGYSSHAHQQEHKITPSPTSTHLAPQSIISHSTATSSMSLASIVSPTTPASLDPSRSYRSNYDSHNAMETESERRESVDGRMAQGFTDMRINSSLPPSPYASHVQNSAASQRIPRPKFDSIQSHRMSNGYQPSADRTPVDIRIDSRTQRQAPTITGPTQGTIARAAEPTKGQAWAFPEDERSGSYTESRRSSLADSINSSQFTSESRLPAGQLRLDGQSTDGHRLSSTSNEYLPVHHHSLQHKKISDLQEESRPTGTQPYSRTPELRQSHKLAERKRRTEMKELFEQLREIMPQERGAKASKWEILTKAISEIKRLNDTIRNMSIHYNSAVNEIENHRREIHSLRMENAELRAKINSHSMGHPNPPSSHGPPHPSSVPPPPSSHYGGSDYGSSRPELPPLRSISNQLPPPGPGPDSMTGVQYDSHRPPY